MDLGHDLLLDRLSPRFSGPRPATGFRGLSSDDREVVPPGEHRLFVAIRGARHDSHRSLGGLATQGFSGAVGEDPPPQSFSLPYYQVTDSRRALSLLWQSAYGRPAQAIRCLGVTGTNGKSTVVRMLAEIASAGGRRSGWIGTVDHCVDGTPEPSTMTTPEPSVLAEHLARFLRAGGQDMMLEVSSHSLDQDRVAGIDFAGAVLTSLSRDHFDYHGNADRYLDAKLRLFEALDRTTPAILPSIGRRWAKHPRLADRELLLFGLEAGPGIVAHPVRIEMDAQGIRGEIEVLGSRIRVRSSQLGAHNLSNMLGAALLARTQGHDAEAIGEGLSRAPAVRGRLEAVPGAPCPTFVDYAHTPDAIEAVLRSARELVTGKLWVIFGCGGDRDAGKRPEMGRIAEKYADEVMVTSDNPRSEDPDRIITAVLAGMENPSRARVEQDRIRAIEEALASVAEEDLLIIAGKGHETKQVLADRVIPLDDRQVVETWVRMRRRP